MALRMIVHGQIERISLTTHGYAYYGDSKREVPDWALVKRDDDWSHAGPGLWWTQKKYKILFIIFLSAAVIVIGLIALCGVRKVLQAQVHCHLISIISFRCFLSLMK